MGYRVEVFPVFSGVYINLDKEYNIFVAKLFTIYVADIILIIGLWTTTLAV